MGPLHGRLPRLHDLAAGRAGTFQEIGARDGRALFEIGQRVLDRPVDHAVDNEAVSGRIDIRDAGVMPFAVHAGWRDSAIARLQGRERGGTSRVHPPHIGLELRAGAITALDPIRRPGSFVGSSGTCYSTAPGGALAKLVRGNIAVAPTAAIKAALPTRPRRVGASANMPSCSRIAVRRQSRVLVLL